MSEMLTLEKTEEHVSGNGTLVCLVEHENRVLRHVGVDETLPLQHTVRHVLDLGLGTGAIFETNRVADLLAETASDLLGDTLGDRHGGDTTRLGTADLELVGESSFGEVLGHLGRLARSRVSDDDEDLVLWVAEESAFALIVWKRTSNVPC
jgi:hypothetical protein